MFSLLISYIQRLRDGGEEWAKGELVKNVRQVHQGVIRVLIAHVPVAKRRDMQIGGYLLNLDTAVNSTGWPVVDFVVCGAVLTVAMLFGRREQPSDTTQRSLIRGSASRRGYDFGSRWVTRRSIVSPVAGALYFFDTAFPTLNSVLRQRAHTSKLTPSFTKSSLKCNRSPTASLKSIERSDELYITRQPTLTWHSNRKVHVKL